MDIYNLLNDTIKLNASDLHLIAGFLPTVRVDGVLKVLLNYPVLNAGTIAELIAEILTPFQEERLKNTRELDFGYSIRGGRFRINVYYERGKLAVAMRLISEKIRTPVELKLPKIVYKFTELKQGLVLVTGPTGHGKSTTLAALINHINIKRSEHIVTIEDPVEYIYPQGKSLISQREMNIDTFSWSNALRAVLREDPDVVLVGEMRDYETISAAITIAETGHLVFATLHTNSAAQTIDRIVDVFPAHQQNQIKTQLAGSLAGIISQRLIPAVGGGRVPATEILITNSAVRNAIREGKSHMIDNIILTSSDIGMISLEHSLSNLTKSGLITSSEGKKFAFRPDEFIRLLEGENKE